jgi:ferredoxin-type protein NapH
MISRLKLKVWRRLSQTVIGLVLTNSYFRVISTKMVYDGPLKSVCIPFLNCHACPFAVFSCPIGMLQHFVATHQIPFFLLGFFTIIGLFVGRAACGWLCPFGLIQDVMYKIKTRKFRIPKLLNYGKYIILIVLVILLPYFTYEHWFSKLCPFGALIAGIPWVSWNPINPDFDSLTIAAEDIGLMYFIKIVILIFFLIWFILAKRPFCRTVCPLGAIWAVFNRISLFKFKVGENCRDCPQCSKLCPMDLDVRTEVDSANCIKCMDCTTCKHVNAKLEI